MAYWMCYKCSKKEHTDIKRFSGVCGLELNSP